MNVQESYSHALKQGNLRNRILPINARYSCGWERDRERRGEWPTGCLCFLCDIHSIHSVHVTLYSVFVGASDVDF